MVLIILSDKFFPSMCGVCVGEQDIYTCVHPCGSQKKKLGIFLYVFSPCLLRQGLSLVWLGWPASECPGFTCLHLPMLGLQAHAAMPGFCGGTRDLNSGLLAYIASTLSH